VITVVAAIIESDGHVLVAQRGDGGRRHGLWEFPGGKREPGETDHQCLVRELQEELNVDVAVGDHYATVEWVYPDVAVLLEVYRAVIRRGTPHPREHQALRWAGRRELENLRFTEADRPVVEKLLHEWM